MTDCRESYFERIFRICKKNEWIYAYDTLTFQGRMHKDLSHFPDKYFYNNILQPISTWQEDPLALKLPAISNKYHEIIVNKRLCFIPTKASELNPIDKICIEESNIVTELSKAMIDIYKYNNLVFDEQKTLGIITPYRNQIALIKHELKGTGVPELQNIMIDTVERYQGSQRDIIIMSFCINKSYQLEFFCNLNREKTVDRKLNVALTRARKQLFLIGNENILRQNDIYNNLLNEVDIFN